MCPIEHGLGRGLDSLFRNASDALSHKKEGSRVSISAVRSNTSQPRTSFDEESLNELAMSIQSKGILQPILVRPVPGCSPVQYEIVAGERRWRAAKKAGMTDIPVIIREMSDSEALSLALVENIQREDLNPVEEARAIDQLRQTQQLSQEDLAKMLGKSRPAIANALRLLQLPSVILDSLKQDRLSAGHARALLMIPDAQAQLELHDMIVEKELSVREAETAAAYWKKYNAWPEGFQTEAASQTVHTTQKTVSRKKTAVILTLQKHLRMHLHPKTTINGTTDMGRLTVPYESEEQLVKLLALLGVGAEDLQADMDESTK